MENSKLDKIIAQCEWAIRQPSPTIIEAKKFYGEALELLKTIKNPVEPHKGEAVIWHGGTEHYYLIDTCGACNERIDEETMYCPHCGTPVKWN